MWRYLPASEAHLYRKLAFPSLGIEFIPKEWVSVLQAQGTGQNSGIESGRELDHELERRTEHSAEQESEEIPEEFSYLEWLEGIQQVLQPEKPVVSRFFHPDFYLLDCLISLIPLAGHSLESWLIACEALPPEEFTEGLLAYFGLHTKGKRSRNQKSEKTLSQDKQLKDQLAQSSMTLPQRWMVMDYLESPEEALQEFVQLYRRIRFLSDAFIDPLENELIPFEDQWKKMTEAYPQQWADYFPSLQEWTRETKSKGEEIFILPSMSFWSVRWVAKDILAVGFKVPQLVQQRIEIQENQQAKRIQQIQILSDPTRYQLCLLAAQKVKTQREMAKRLGMSPGTVCHHVRLLREADLLSRGKELTLRREVFDALLLGLEEDFQLHTSRE